MKAGNDEGGPLAWAGSIEARLQEHPAARRPPGATTNYALSALLYSEQADFLPTGNPAPSPFPPPSAW